MTDEQIYCLEKLNLHDSKCFNCINGKLFNGDFRCQICLGVGDLSVERQIHLFENYYKQQLINKISSSTRQYMLNLSILELEEIANSINNNPKFVPVHVKKPIQL